MGYGLAGWQSGIKARDRRLSRPEISWWITAQQHHGSVGRTWRSLETSYARGLQTTCEDSLETGEEIRTEGGGGVIGKTTTGVSSGGAAGGRVEGGRGLRLWLDKQMKNARTKRWWRNKQRTGKAKLNERNETREKRVKTIGQWRRLRGRKREREREWRWFKRMKHVEERWGNDWRRQERRRRYVVTTVGQQTRSCGGERERERERRRVERVEDIKERWGNDWRRE